MVDGTVDSATSDHSRLGGGAPGDGGLGGGRLGGGGLGRSVARRWAPPGPRSRARPAPLGSVAEAAMRFSAGLGRPPQIRRQLAGPASVRPASGFGPVRPPLWWLPNERGGSPVWGGGNRGDGNRAPTRIPDRLLRRAAGRVPAGSDRQPGSAGVAMAGKSVPVRRIPDVQFSGPMRGAASKLVRPRSRDGVAGPSGAGTGTTGTGTPAAGPSGQGGPGIGGPGGSAQNGRAGSRGAVGPPGPRPGDGGTHLFAARAVPRSSVSTTPKFGVGVRRAAAAAVAGADRARSTPVAQGRSPATAGSQFGRWTGSAMRSTGSVSTPGSDRRAAQG